MRGMSGKRPEKLAHTPMMAQYHGLKEQHTDCLLFFRMGEFYELFFEDAVLAAKALDIALTRRGKQEGEDVPMCGVPAHASDAYLARLIRKGYKVAICEQMESPKGRNAAKGPLKRDVVRIVTPGTLTEDALLEANRHNFLLSVCDEGGRAAGIGLAFVDISTGDFWTEFQPLRALASILSRVQPREILLPERLAQNPDLFEVWGEWKTALNPLPNSRFNLENGVQRLQNLYQVSNLNAFGDFTNSEVAAAGMLVDYITLTQKEQVPRLGRPRRLNPGKFLELDAFTRRNLELTQTLSGGREGSLLHVMDCTVTAAGSRLLFLRLSSPLCVPSDIHQRLDTVEFFVRSGRDSDSLLSTVRATLKGCPDIERPFARLGTGRGGPRDLAALAAALGCVPHIQALLSPTQSEWPKGLRQCLEGMADHTELVALLNRALDEKLPVLAREGGFIAAGYDGELDEFRRLRDEGQVLIAQLQDTYIQETGISGLRIRHNNIVGYTIEVSGSQQAKIPFHFTHRQTLANSVRYTTATLVDLEQRLQSAAEHAMAREHRLFEELVKIVQSHGESICKTAKMLAILDVTLSHAHLALAHGLTRPQVDDSIGFRIQGGRHLVVEDVLRATPTNTPFVPNDCVMEGHQRLWLITGPNMAGKSTFLRQNALIALMAQMGAFVPATQAHIGVIDRIFSRVGASDDLARGHSTFMVEMMETATILNQATERSLVILDEVGRGTATYDGLSLAWACVEHLASRVQCRTLFATHYHELTPLEERIPSVACYTLQVKEWDGKVLFLHKVERGTADRSYGVHVARLAGLPEGVLQRAEEVLASLENKPFEIPVLSSAPVVEKISPLESFVANINVDELSPREALNVLYQVVALQGDNKGGQK